MTAKALDGVTLVELGTMVAAPYCAKLLADFGAEVVKVESAEGDPSRRIDPFGVEEDEEVSPLFLYNNTGKRSVCCDFRSAEDLGTLRGLLESADVLVDSLEPGTLEGLELGAEALRALNPSLVRTTITPYGRSGPRAHVPGGELTVSHAGGLANLLPSRSDSVNRAPVKLGGWQLEHTAGVVAALATLGALYGRENDSRGRLIDISVQEVSLALVAPLVALNRYQDTTWSRVPDRPPAMGRLQTRDGYVIVNAFDDHHFDAFRDLIGNPDWCAGEEWRSMSYRAHHLMEIAAKIEEWMLGQAKDEVHHRAAKKGIPIGPIASAADVMANPQFEARDFFVEVEHPRAGRHRYAGSPYRMAASPPRPGRPAPLLGEHDEEVRAERSVAGTGPKKAAVAPPSAPSLPLAGIRVAELCWVWAGPYAGMLLASLGAEVIKVEGHRRTDLMRRSVNWPLPEPAPRHIPPNQGMAFNSVNLYKKSLAVDLSQDEGVEIARRLAATSDLVVDNMRPGALAKLGLGYDDLRRQREDIIVASSSGRGHVGPERNYLGFASVHQGLGGGAYVTGYPDSHPCHSGGDVDLLNAMTLAVSLLAALHHRRRTGEGQFIDFSQSEGACSILGDLLLGFEMTGQVPERMGNAHPVYAPHGVYAAWGTDRWIALEIRDDDEFFRLAKALGQAELAVDDRFSTRGARKKNEAELDRLIEEWTRDRDRDWMVAKFEEAGLAVAPSRNARDLYADRQLRERGSFVTVAHPELGDLELVGAPWKMSDAPPPDSPAPLLGEHNHEILEELLGYSPEEVKRLRALDVLP